MGLSAVSQLQASAAQAVADLGGSKHQHEEAAYLSNSPALKRSRVSEPNDMRAAMSSQLVVSSAEGSNRSAVAQGV